MLTPSASLRLFNKLPTECSVNKEIKAFCMVPIFPWEEDYEAIALSQWHFLDSKPKRLVTLLSCDSAFMCLSKSVEQNQKTHAEVTLAL